MELHSVTIGYRQGHDTKVVAEGISGTIEAGQLTCLLGPNGIGKSTLLRTVSAFQPHLSGRILLKGKDIQQYTKRELSRLVGVVLTEKTDVRNMTVRELVGLGRSPYTGFWGTLSADDYAIVDDSIRQVGIQSLTNRSIDTLSDGERQKSMTAKALAQQTDIIILDEPTAFLDFPSKVELMQLLRQLARMLGKTILMSTHDVELALQLSDTLWLMQPGRLSIGTPRQLADNGTLNDFISQQGITFDASTLRIQVNKQ